MTDLTGSRVLLAHPGAELYGSDRMLLESADALAAAGAHVVVTTPDLTGPLLDALDRRGIETVVCPTVVLRRAHMTPRGLVRLTLESLSAFRAGWRLIRRLDVHAVYVNTLTIPLWLVITTMLRRVRICHVHEAEAETPTMLQLVLAAPLLLSHSVIVNSAVTRGVLTRSIRSLGSRCVVVHNGVQGPPSPVRPRSSIEDPVRLAFIGRISERKGVQDAVSTVGRLRRRGIEARLDVVGSIFPGYEYMERLLHESISADGTDELITFHGFVSPVWPVLESTDILLVPSRGDESFGNTAVEGLLAARPVVVTEVPGLREATEGFENVVVVPRADPEAMAAAIEGFISDWPAAVDRSMPESAMATQRYSTERYGAAIVQAVAAAVSS